MQFAALDDNSVFQPLLDSQVCAGIRLVGGPEHPIPLHVRLSAAADQILFLETGQPFLEVFVVTGGPRIDLVRLVGNVVNGVCRVDPHAALDAAPHLVAEHPGHVLLPMQIFPVLMDVVETVDPLACQVGNRRAQILVFRFGRFIIGEPDGVETVPLEFIGPVDQVAVMVQVSFHLGEAPNVFFLGSHGGAPFSRSSVWRFFVKCAEARYFR